MKLLFDQNLSRKLPRRLADLFPGSIHIFDFLLDRTTDTIIWAYAWDNDLTIVTKDDDFRARSVRLGHPPKVIWLDVGNCPSRRIESMLRSHSAQIEGFGADPIASLLTLR